MSYDGKSLPLRVKILASLFLVLGLSMSVSLYGIWTFERDQLIEITRGETMRIGHTIKSGLRHAMLQHNTVAITSSMEEMAHGTLLANISVLDKQGRIAFSSEPSLRGAIRNRADDPACLICHTDEKTAPSQKMVIMDVNGQPILRNVLSIENEAECTSCHPAGQKSLGLFVFDSSLAPFYKLLRATASRLILTGLITFAGIILVVSYIVSRFITNPIHALLDGFDRVGKGELDHWLELNGSREFADIAVAFNVMSRAVRRYLGEVREKAKEITTLYSIVQRMSKSIEWKQVKDVVVSLLREVLEAEQVVLVIPIEKKERHFAVYWKQDEKRLYRSDYYLDAPHDPHPTLPRADFERWIEQRYMTPVFLDDDTRVLIPLLFKETQFGLISVIKKQGQEFSSSQKKLVAALTQHVSIAFTNARLYDMAITDSLTGLYTKRYLRTKLQDLVNIHGRIPEEGFCLMMLDLDHFKEINDTHGHPVGDQILVQMARLIQRNLRHEDIPCRYGGEEFVLLIPGETIDEALLIAERLRQKVEKYTFISPDAPSIQRTVSIGLANCPLHATTAEELIRAADAALYAAKRGGRNQVQVFSAAGFPASGER